MTGRTETREGRNGPAVHEGSAARGSGAADGGGGPDFASASLPRHLLRGLVGFGAVAGGLVLLPVVGIASLLLVPAGLWALRGCPMCWLIGLAQTISRGRVQRACREDGVCSVSLRKSEVRSGS
ncbi:hypothetical protein ACIQBJ_06610 [Kitasatospora sp. NPDC088391]|uniref:hypothetical protein n=1 Tax=Kitasatospora sp. NPDC088391 TaxID=3364074 RepID=UPI003816E57A